MRAPGNEGRAGEAAAGGCGRGRDACGGGGPMSGRKAVLDQNHGVRNISLLEGEDDDEDNDGDGDNDEKNWKGNGDGFGVIPEDLEAPLHHCPCIPALLPPHCSHCESVELSNAL